MASRELRREIEKVQERLRPRVDLAAALIDARTNPRPPQHTRAELEAMTGNRGVSGRLARARLRVRRWAPSVEDLT